MVGPIGDRTLLGKAPDQNVVWREAFPIDQAVRQTEEAKAREAKLAAEGLSQAEIKVARKHETLIQEQVYDDRGRDFGPVEETQLLSALAVGGALNAAVARSHPESHAFARDSAESLEDELGRVLNDNFSFHCLVGSDGHFGRKNPPKSEWVPIWYVHTSLSQPKCRGSVDIVYLFGGDPDAGELCIRRRLLRGMGGIST